MNWLNRKAMQTVTVEISSHEFSKIITKLQKLTNKPINFDKAIKIIVQNFLNKHFQIEQFDETDIQWLKDDIDKMV